MLDRSSAPPRILAAALTLALAGCSGGFPADPDGTLARIKADGVLRAGAAPHPPQVEIPAPGAEPTGNEVEPVEAYGEHLGVDVEWIVGTESTLFEALHGGEVDLVVGGLQHNSLFASEAGFTRPYLEETASDGEETIKRVMATPMGENALLTDLERFLDEEAGW